MHKPKTIFHCQSCGFQSPKWQGKCPSCEQWNSFQEEVAPKNSKKRSLLSLPTGSKSAIPIADLQDQEIERITLDLAEINRVLGGGLVPGSVVLLGGDPGIGKSTLILQILHAVAQKGFPTLYVSGEESRQQIHLRAKRILTTSPNLFVLTETQVENVFAFLEKSEPFPVICLDSIQTLFSEELESAAGTIGQIRHVSAQLVDYAKKTNTIVFLIGHVTKEGAIAGPRVLEHMVDTVLYFESNEGHPYRILRTTKNRFGSTNEIGVFEMTNQGLLEVQNPSELFLSDHVEEKPGSAITVPLEGTRPLLVEIQSLTLPCYGGSPRRTCMGMDSNRVSLLAAVIQRELQISLTDQDLYVKVTGGMKITEPAADLGLVASMVSSRLNRPLHKGTVFFGEVGLTGEVRAIQQPELRILEAEKLGYQICVLPHGNTKRLEKSGKKPSIQLKSIHHIREIVAFLHQVRSKGSATLSPVSQA